MNVDDKVYLKNEIEQSFLTNIILSPYRIISKKSTLLQDNKGNKFRDTQFMLESNKWVSETELVPFENIAMYLGWLYNKQYTRQLRAITNVFTYTNFAGKLHIIHPCCKELYWILENALMETKAYDCVLDAYVRDTGWQLVYQYCTFEEESYRTIESVPYQYGHLGSLFKNWLLSQTEDCSWEDFMKYYYLDFQEKE